METLETFPRVFCFLKSRINGKGGKLDLLFQFPNHRHDDKDDNVWQHGVDVPSCTPQKYHLVSQEQQSSQSEGFQKVFGGHLRKEISDP